MQLSTTSGCAPSAATTLSTFSTLATTAGCAATITTSPAFHSPPLPSSARRRCLTSSSTGALRHQRQWRASASATFLSRAHTTHISVTCAPSVWSVAGTELCTDIVLYLIAVYPFWLIVECSASVPTITWLDRGWQLPTNLRERLPHFPSPFDILRLLPAFLVSDPPT